MRNRILSITSSLVLTSACAADVEAPDRTESIARDDQDLFMPQGAYPWNRTIPLCFATPGLAREKAVFSS